MENKQLLPGWNVVERIGSGGFSSVYKIKKNDDTGDFYSALKVISVPKDDDEYKTYKNDGYDNESITKIFKSQVNDLVKEFKLMARFRGTTNIVSYEDHVIVPKENGIGWNVLIRMELLTTLPEYYNTHPLNEAETLKLGMDICRALELCEKFDVVHRDIKPQNIFVNDFGDFKLGDFGVARAMEHTTHATKVGTYTYMAPEVYRGDKYNCTADIYSLGMVLYWLLNERRLPFVPLPPNVPTPAESNEAQVRRMNGEALPPPKHGSEALKQIVLTACAPNPLARFKNAAEMGAALQEATAHIVAAPVEEVISSPADILGNDGKTIAVRRAPGGYAEDNGAGDKTIAVRPAPTNDYDKTIAVRPAPGGYAEDNAPAKKEKKPRNALKGILVALCALIIVAVGAIVFYFVTNKDSASDTDESRGAYLAWGDDTTSSYYNNGWDDTSSYYYDEPDESGDYTGDDWNYNSSEDDWGWSNDTTEEIEYFNGEKAKVGDYITFGSYEQDNDTSNGKEAIEWLVLDIQDGKALIISKYALDCQPYNTKYESVTWETCTLRTWLNNSFLNSAFSSSEIARIPTVTVSADENPSYSTDPGNATQDKVFLLSITEVNKYFSSYTARQCKATAYAIEQGALTSTISGYEGNCWWWLRSPGDYQYGAAGVYHVGDVNYRGYSAGSSYLAVRPALWINLNS